MFNFMSKAQHDDSDYFFDVKTLFENVKFLEVGLLLNKNLSNATMVQSIARLTANPKV